MAGPTCAAAVVREDGRDAVPAYVDALLIRVVALVGA